MYKKMRSSMVIIGMCGLCGVISGMEQQEAYKQAIRKSIIPILAINNYVMPVSSAYKALKKEADLVYESIEKIKFMSRFVIASINKRVRQHKIKKGMSMFSIPITKSSSEVLHPAGPSVIRLISVTYKNSLEDCDQLEAHLKIGTRLYRARPSKFRSVKYCEYEYTVKNINALKKEIERLLPEERRFVGIELSSGDKHASDWILIKNRYNATANHIYHEEAMDIASSLELLQDGNDSLNIDSRDITILSDDLEEHMACAPFCKRMIIIAGTLLSLYVSI